MKLLKAVLLVSALAVTGCKEGAEMVALAQATPVASKDVAYTSPYSGANIPSNAARGQVYEYH